MAAYIGAVRQEVADLIPACSRTTDLRFIAPSATTAISMLRSSARPISASCPPTTERTGPLHQGVQDTSGGDGDEFYELVIKKIVGKPWREGSSRTILLIADAEPHELGYTYENIIKGTRSTGAKKLARLLLRRSRSTP